jgi:hypothetical protein
MKQGVWVLLTPYFCGGIFMIVRVDSWLHRLIFRLPVFLPHSVEYCRVGDDYISYRRVNWRKPRGIQYE